MAVFDLTLTMEDGMPVYPGDPAVALGALATVDSNGFANARLVTGMHAGTHMDAPAHFIPGGARLCDIPADRFVRRATLVDASGLEEIGRQILSGHPVIPGGALVFRTGWSRRFGREEYFSSHPVLTEATAEVLADLGVTMAGIDMPSPDREPFPVHRLLLSRGILILENLTGLEALPEATEFRLIALPLKIRADSAPARVIAEV